MEKTDGLVELLAVEVGKFSIPSNKEITKLANSVRTYISERLPQERHTRPEQCTSNEMFANTCKTDYVWNTCLKSVREALGLGERCYGRTMGIK